MRTVDGLRDIVVQVRAEPASGEHVFISGSSPELGEWIVSKAVMLSKVSPEGNIWGGVIKVPVDKNIQYRYLMCIIVDNDGKQENIVRHWESHLRPRILCPTDYVNGKCDLNSFGFQDDIESVSSGWLTAETIVQLKMFNNPVTIWKRRYREKRISVHVSTIDISRRESDMLGIEDDSTSPEGLPNSWPVVEVAKMNEGGWQFSSQSQFGIIYDPAEYVIFQAQMLKPDTIAYMVDFYVHESEIPDHIGFCYILPSNLRDTSGTCNMPISGKRQQPIGQLAVEYLIVRPMKDFVCDLSVSYAKHWRNLGKRGLDVGHRGAGNARRNDKVENVLENTVASFNYAAKHGADMVELDVQLSKDLVPVIYHDYYICISMKKKKTQHEHELLQLAVKDLTAQQLRMLKLSPAHNGEANHDFHEDDSDDNQPFPTLKHVLEAVDPSVGFNIEIKCPMQYHDGTWELDHRFEMNSYMDIILKNILENAGNRYIVLSCFHPDICSMVRLKQNKYPLLFLTQGQTDKYPPYLDTRTASIPMAAYFALNMGILGINVHAEDLIRDPSLIPFVKDHKLVLFCWGDDINHSDVIRSLKEQGVDGVIYDKLDGWDMHVVSAVQENSEDEPLKDVKLLEWIMESQDPIIVIQYSALGNNVIKWIRARNIALLASVALTLTSLTLSSLKKTKTSFAFAVGGTVLRGLHWYLLDRHFIGNYSLHPERRTQAEEDSDVILLLKPSSRIFSVKTALSLCTTAISGYFLLKSNKLNTLLSDLLNGTE